MYTPRQDSVVETPPKRRKLGFDSSPGAQTFNSQDADADDLFTDLDIVDTIPTFPPQFHLYESQLQTQNLPVSQNTFVTQPTQILPNIVLPTTPNRPRVQVPASSPAALYNETLVASRQMSSLTRNGFGQNVQRKQTFGTSIAPPGTNFRPPQSIYGNQSRTQSAQWSQGFRYPTSPPKQPFENIIEIDDDEDDLVYKGGFSDDESQNPRDIKPSVVKRKNPSAMVNGNGVTHQQNSAHARFTNILVNSKYQNPGRLNVYDKPPNTVPSASLLSDARFTAKRSSDLMTAAYAGRERPPKQPRPSAIVQNQPEFELTLDEIPDIELRRAIERLLVILGQTKTIRQIRDALLSKRCNESDAMALLIEDDPKPQEIDLTTSDDEIKAPRPSKTQPTRSTTKQQLKQPTRTIHQKYGLSSQAIERAANPAPIVSPIKEQPELIQRPVTPVQAPAPRKRLVQARKKEQPDLIQPPVTPVQDPAPRKRLVQEQKKEQPELIQLPVIPVQAPAPRPRRRLVQGRKPKLPSPAEPSSPDVVDDDSDSGIDAEGEIEHQESLERLRLFFNSCLAADIVDMANINKTMAEHFVSMRPFETLEDVRAVTEPGDKVSAKARRQKRTLGDKVMDVCVPIWAGYEAVDKVVERCRLLRRPITKGMKEWGVDVVGFANDGEVDLVNLDGAKKSPSLRDSGIGTPTTSDEDDDIKIISKHRPTLLQQPQLMSNDIALKDYQVIGMNWLSLLYRKNLSCILADDMGLGKTCQVIAFLAHLYEIEGHLYEPLPDSDLEEKERKGPHLIVVPGSTLENWLREFEIFCPNLSVTSYYGSQAERKGLEDEILKKKRRNKPLPYVIITTYTIATQKRDRIFLKKLNLTCGIFDEGHELKNCKSTRHIQLMRIKVQFRLLLTGTPLQNNLTELMSLLNFIMPNVFSGYQEKLEVIFKHKAKTNEESHDALLSTQRITRARSMMAPFILRRKKEQVLESLPKKTSRVEYCDLNPSQKTIYQEHLEKAKRIIAARQRAKETKEFVKDSSNVLMDLRKACCHPLLFRRLYTDKDLPKVVKAYLRNPAESHRSFDLCLEDMQVCTDHNIHRFCLDPNNAAYMSKFALGPEPLLDSGKVTKLVELLQRYKANGDRALIFSQFVMVMDILEEVLSHTNIAFFRIDGATRVDERQPLIDVFYADESVTAFMLSTKAGGAGINLAAANKVIIFDSSFNPQDDIQAENRAHRFGQKRDVEVVRLVTRGTIEEQIHALGESKVLLDARVAGGEEGKKARDGERMVREALEREVSGAGEGKEDVMEEVKEEEAEKNGTMNGVEVEEVEDNGTTSSVKMEEEEEEEEEEEDEWDDGNETD
ncbi:hypothetical protein MMC10_010683 [Thelotrema lepadinum]|nr:hypothetical protein [Thelotrema lepadinum]